MILPQTAEEKKLKAQLRYRDKLKPITYIRKLVLLTELTGERNDEEAQDVYASETLRFITKDILHDLTPEEFKEVRDYIRDAHTVLGRRHFHNFLIAMEWNRDKEKKFYEPRMSVLRSVVQDLEDLEYGRISVYGLSMPPRVGKSTLGLFYMCWVGGRHPMKSILASGYSTGLVKSFYDGTIEFMTSDEYRFRDIFPENPLVDQSAKDLTLDLRTPARYKTFTFRSIDGTVTGATEASSLLYLDDLVSGIEEAMNKDRLDSLWSKVTVNMLQRMKQGCKLLIIGTRWSVHDPLYKISLDHQDDPTARFKCIPALNPDGSSNFRYAYNVGYDEAYYENIRRSVDTISWECVFQQNPIEREGLLFAPDTLKRYYTLPDGKPDAVTAFCDVAFGGEDYLSFPIIYTYGEDDYLVDCVCCNKLDYQSTEPLVASKIEEHGVQLAVFESNNGGDFFARDVAKMIPKSVKCAVRWERAPSNTAKNVRILQNSADIRNIYFLDEALAEGNPMYKLFLSQLCTYNENGKNKHDDIPDSLAGWCKINRNKVRTKAVVIDRPQWL